MPSDRIPRTPRLLARAALAMCLAMLALPASSGAESAPGVATDSAATSKAVNLAITLFRATARGTAGEVKAALASGAQVDYKETQTGATAIMIAAARGDTTIIAVLLDAGADVNVHAQNGMTPLMAASYKAQPDACMELLRAGADLAARDTSRMGAEGFARMGRCDACLALFSLVARVSDYAIAGQRDSLRALIAHGVPVTVPSADGTPALQSAAGQGHVEIVHDLIAAGAQVNRADRLGLTALHHAAAKGHADVVKVLLAAGASTTLRAADGNTALETAKASHQDAVASLLEKSARK